MRFTLWLVMLVPKYGAGGCYLYIYVLFTLSQHQLQSNVPVLDLITYYMIFIYQVLLDVQIRLRSITNIVNG